MAASAFGPSKTGEVLKCRICGKDRRALTQRRGDEEQAYNRAGTLSCLNIPPCQQAPSALQEPDFIQLVPGTTSKTCLKLLTPGPGSQTVPLRSQLTQIKDFREVAYGLSYNITMSRENGVCLLYTRSLETEVSVGVSILQ